MGVMDEMQVPMKWDRKPYARVFTWLPEGEIEEGALDQITNLAYLPSAKHVAVMPDAHKGYGMPIGTVLATEGTVVPYAVGVDIGCGMIAVKTDLPVANAPRELVRKALEGIFARVPVGQPGRGRDRDAGSFKDRQNSEVLREWFEAAGAVTDGAQDTRERADRQLGTLGGGNHFIEVQSDGTNVWLMLHTGSRSFGKNVCDRWYKYALLDNERYYTPLSDKELAFLPLQPYGYLYMDEMRYAMRFAEESRKRIEDRSIEAMLEAFGPFNILQRIETHHNFASIEKHMGKTLVVHRKGAVRTVEPVANGPYGEGPITESVLVTIPGSMQTGSYIGLGQPSVLALNTCSHGAGRRLGRNQAKREWAALGNEMGGHGVALRDSMDAQGIEIVTPEGSDVVDEGGFAYKDIENVMRYQADLVEPVVRLTPLGVVKG